MMFDDLRNVANEYSEEDQQASEEIGRLTPIIKKTMPEKRVFGMTASQRFVLVLILLLMTCVLGVFFLILTESIYLPLF